MNKATLSSSPRLPVKLNPTTDLIPHARLRFEYDQSKSIYDFAIAIGFPENIRQEHPLSVCSTVIDILLCQIELKDKQLLNVLLCQIELRDKQLLNVVETLEQSTNDADYVAPVVDTTSEPGVPDGFVEQQDSLYREGLLGLN